jgi:hypothetical protein
MRNSTVDEKYLGLPLLRNLLIVHVRNGNGIAIHLLGDRINGAPQRDDNKPFRLIMKPLISVDMGQVCSESNGCSSVDSAVKTDWNSFGETGIRWRHPTCTW